MNSGAGQNRSSPLRNLVFKPLSGIREVASLVAMLLSSRKNTLQLDVIFKCFVFAVGILATLKPVGYKLLLF